MKFNINYSLFVNLLLSLNKRCTILIKLNDLPKAILLQIVIILYTNSLLHAMPQ